MNTVVTALLIVVWVGFAVGIAWALAEDVRSLDRRHDKPKVGEPPSNVNVFWPDQ